MIEAAEQAFLHDPGAWADPALAADCFVPGLQARTVERLLASSRLAARASTVLARHIGTGSLDELSTDDRQIVLASAETLARIAILAGAVWHGRRLRAVVLASEIAALIARYGEAVRIVALRLAALSADEGTGGDLADDIAHDGARCLAGWIDSLPGWAAARVRLKWSTTEPALSLPRAVEIVRAVAREANA